MDLTNGEITTHLELGPPEMAQELFNETRALRKVPGFDYTTETLEDLQAVSLGLVTLASKTVVANGLYSSRRH